MNSDTSTRYGSRVLRHGKSRAARAHQARSLRVNTCARAGLRTRGVDVRAMGTQDTAHEQRCGAHAGPPAAGRPLRSEEHTSELQSQSNLVCRLLLEKKKE